MNNMSANVNELMTALAKAQGKIQPASKDKANPYFKSKYADLASVWDACRDALSDNGLSVIQTVDHRETSMVLITILGHSSGQWVRSEMPIITAKNDPQTLGSAITYYRRYCLSAIVGVAPDDDDGEKAQTPYRKEDSKPKKISQIEADTLQQIIDECDPKYKSWMSENLAKNFNIFSLNDLTLDIYDKIKNQANIRKNKYLAKLQEEENNVEQYVSL